MWDALYLILQSHDKPSTPPPLEYLTPMLDGTYTSQAVLSRSLVLLDAYEPPDLLALQLRCVAGLRWLPPVEWLKQVGIDVLG